MRGSLGSIVEGSGAHARVILRICIWNTSVVPLELPAFDNNDSVGSPLRQVVYPPGSMVLPWVTASRFLAGNRESVL